MSNFQKKKNLQYILKTKPFLFLLGIIIIFFSLSVFSLFEKMRETIKNRRMVEKKVIELQQKKEKLISDIEKLKTEEGKEVIFRENFSLSKEGEGMIMIVEDKDSPSLETEKEGSFLKTLFK